MKRWYFLRKAMAVDSDSLKAGLQTTGEMNFQCPQISTWICCWGGVLEEECRKELMLIKTCKNCLTA